MNAPNLIRVAVVGDGTLARERTWRSGIQRQPYVEFADPADAQLVVVTGSSDGTAVAAAVERQQHVVFDQPFPDADAMAAAFAAAARHQRLLAYVNPLGRPVAWLREQGLLATLIEANPHLWLGPGHGGVELAVAAMDALAAVLPVVDGGLLPLSIEPRQVGDNLVADISWPGGLRLTVTAGPHGRDHRLEVGLEFPEAALSLHGLLARDERVRAEWLGDHSRPLPQGLPASLNDCHEAVAGDLLHAIRTGTWINDPRPAIRAAGILAGLRAVAD